MSIPPRKTGYKDTWRKLKGNDWLQGRLQGLQTRLQACAPCQIVKVNLQLVLVECWVHEKADRDCHTLGNDAPRKALCCVFLRAR
mgnify:CR=1 FL=1